MCPARLKDNTLLHTVFHERAHSRPSISSSPIRPSPEAWTNGFARERLYGRFDFGCPPQKNGDYAFLLHILACLKSTGKAPIILPHGVLFRGGAEADIRTDRDAGLHQRRRRSAGQPLLRDRNSRLYPRAR